jgi:hypothetical protein
VCLPANCKKIVANVVLPEINKFFSEAAEKAVLLHNGGSCNDCITKRCLHFRAHYRRNMCNNDVVSQRRYDKKAKK